MARAFRADPAGADLDEGIFASARTPSGESSLWHAVLLQVIMDVQLGLAILQGRRHRSTTDALRHGRDAALWMLNPNAHGCLVEAVLGLDLSWWNKIIDRGFGRDELERLAAVKTTPPRSDLAAKAATARQKNALAVLAYRERQRLKKAAQAAAEGQHRAA